MVFVFPNTAEAAIAFDAASNGRSATSDQTLTVSHVVSGSNRLLVVAVTTSDSIDADRPITGITYAGTPLTKATSTQNNAGDFGAEIWYLVAPSTGTNNIIITATAGITRIVGGGVSLTGIDQTTPLDATGGAQGSSGESSAVVTTVADNAWVVDANAQNTSGGATVGTDQTERWNNIGTVLDGASSTEGPKTPAGAVTMSWTFVSSQWAISAASFAPSAAASTAATPSLIIQDTSFIIQDTSLIIYN